MKISKFHFQKCPCSLTVRESGRLRECVKTEFDFKNNMVVMVMVMVMVMMRILVPWILLHCFCHTVAGVS